MSYLLTIMLIVAIAALSYFIVLLTLIAFMMLEETRATVDDREKQRGSDAVRPLQMRNEQRGTVRYRKR